MEKARSAPWYLRGVYILAALVLAMSATLRADWPHGCCRSSSSCEQSGYVCCIPGGYCDCTWWGYCYLGFCAPAAWDCDLTQVD
jgi:hypothetical protein